jgi:hypothetical protein
VATIGGISRTTASGGAGLRLRTASNGDAAAAPAARALVAVEPAQRTVPPSITSHRNSADFLAHLIATDQQAPQTRTRRRAEPAQAILAYGAAYRLPAAVRPPVFSKTY